MSRQELSRALWPEGTFVHFDHGLNSCIKQIRAVLGDSRTAPRYVETLTRRGYRFIAPVMLLTQSESQRRPKLRLRALPARALDGDPDSAALAEGLNEELAAQLANAAPSDFLVMASGTAATCAEAEAPPADYVLQATVRSSGSRLRVTTQLIDAREHCHVWAGRFDASFDHPFDAQSAAAESIVCGVMAALGLGRGSKPEHTEVETEPSGAPLPPPRREALERVS